MKYKKSVDKSLILCSYNATKLRGICGTRIALTHSLTHSLTTDTFKNLDGIEHGRLRVLSGLPFFIWRHRIFGDLPGFIRDVALMFALLKDQICYAVDHLYLFRLSVR